MSASRPRRLLLPVAVLLAPVALAACGGSEAEADPAQVLMSEDADPQDVADAWTELVCVEDAVDVAQEYPTATITLSCPNEKTDPDLPADPDPADLPDTNELSVFSDPSEFQEGDSVDCDNPYMTLAGPLWVARVYYGPGQEDLLDLGAEVICEGN